MKTNWFATMAHNAAKAAGSSSAFMAICGITLLWMATGPLFHWSDTWQLVINTVTNIVSIPIINAIRRAEPDTAAGPPPCEADARLIGAALNMTLARHVLLKRCFYVRRRFQCF